MLRCSHFHTVLFIVLWCWAAPDARAQLLADTSFTWQGYAQPGRCHVQIFTSSDDKRTHTVVIREMAANRGPSTAFDLPYLAEEVSRHFHLDPTTVYWVLHWGAFSYEGARSASKELFLRATFRRTKSQRLSSPQWDLVSRDEVRAYTDRHFD